MKQFKNSFKTVFKLFCFTFFSSCGRQLPRSPDRKKGFNNGGCPTFLYTNFLNEPNILLFNNIHAYHPARRHAPSLQLTLCDQLIVAVEQRHKEQLNTRKLTKRNKKKHQ